ncbi:type VII secretion protein EccB [Streptomyces sp. NPDC054933]
MASRRDELNAYTFARKRTLAAFLQPSPAGSEEGAPRPLRALAPSLVVGALLLAGFGAWGMIKPGAPQGWDTPGAKVLVGSESTTRYVVLNTDGKAELHPVLNLASAKLLLDPQKFGVLKIQESVLDSGKIPHGPTLGIPYAPDRLPSSADAGTAKLWAVCERPGQGTGDVQKATFVLANRDVSKVDGAGRLSGDQGLFVQGPDGAQYLVDPIGTKYPIGNADWKSTGKTGQDAQKLLVRILFGGDKTPQLVTDDWLATFNRGNPVEFPQVDGIGGAANVPGLSPQLNKVGMVLIAPSGTGSQKYVVLANKVARVSDLVAKLLLNMPGVTSMYPGSDHVPAPQQVAAQDFTPDDTPFYADRGWPQQPPQQVNDGSSAASCSVYRGSVDGNNQAQVSVWTGQHFPATVVDGGTSAYVTPGSGLLYRQTVGGSTDTGSVFLVTDTGLRYAVQSNNDSNSHKSNIGADPSASADPQHSGQGQNSGQSQGQSQQQADQAQVRLGYGQVQPVPVPQAWSAFLPAGPTLDTNDAAQPQGS